MMLLFDQGTRKIAIDHAHIKIVEELPRSPGWLVVITKDGREYSVTGDLGETLSRIEAAGRVA